jgi:hypothetical protein
MNTTQVNKIIVLVRREAANRRDSAGYSGRWDDGGASTLETQVEYFNYGRAGTLPPEWAKFALQVSNEADPEYAKYLELRKKFG